jgi:serine/threonine-protein kinase
MSAVYRAIQTTLDRPVALKLLPPEFANDPTFIARFLQEARAAAALQHPHIIPIYDSGQVDGRYYIAMRYVDGLPLARAIPAEGLPVQRAVHIVEQIASALDYAHARGVIHRDVSAGNVMLEAGDRVTLMDFGIAQARQGSRLTRAGVAVGTLEYLSPEQARGEVATPQSDIYSLGVLTYELMSGKLPFAAADDRGLLLLHLNAPPPSIRRLRPEIPPGIDAAIQRCLVKDPASRFLSAAAFVTALNAALADSRRRTAVIAPPGGLPPGTAPPVRCAAAAPPKQAAAAGAVSPRAASPARPRLVRRRRLPRWVLLAPLLLFLAVAGVAYAQRGAQLGQSPGLVRSVERTLTSRAAAIASSTALHSNASVAAQPTATAIPPAATAVPTAAPVHPALPQDAVQGFYVALNRALQNGHDAAGMAAAYAYLSPTAQFQLPFADFQRQYVADTSLAWSWRPPLYAADQKSANVAVGLTEYRNGGNATSSFAWVTVTDGANGWHLDHLAATSSAAPLIPASNAGNGHGKGHKGD